MKVSVKTYIEHSEIVEICKRIGRELTEKFRDKNPVVVCVLKGAAPFHAELVKHIDTDIEVDYIQVKSYAGTQTTGNVLFVKDLDIDVSGRDVVLVEDIVDTGRTFLKLKNEFKTRGASSLTFVTLLDKPSRREVDFEPDIVGKTIDNLFVIGFGLDYNEKYRNLKDICVME